jgi:hypothetical protein
MYVIHWPMYKSCTIHNALDIDAIYNLKHNLTDSFTTKFNAKYPWLPIMTKQHECIL